MKPQAKAPSAEYRRRFLGHGAAVIATAALAGCVARGNRSGNGGQPPGGGGQPPGGGTTDPTSADLVGKTLRVYHSGDALTRDFRQDRANIELDSDDRIVSVWIG